MYQFRIDANEKAAAFDVFEWMGLKPAQAIRLFFRHIRKTKKMPFEIEHIPNAKTAKALLKDDYSKAYTNLDNLFSDLHI